MESLWINLKCDWLAMHMAAASRNGEGVGDLPKPLVVLEIDISPFSRIKPNDYNVFLLKHRHPRL